MDFPNTRQAEKLNILINNAISISHLALEMLKKTEEYSLYNTPSLQNEIIKKLEPKMNLDEDTLSLLCIQYLATEQPVVKMLRTVVMIIKMSSHFERVADLCKGIVLSCERYHQQHGSTCGKILQPLIKKVKEMLEDAVYCFENSEDGKARSIKALDREVNSTRLEIVFDTLKKITENPKNSLGDYEIFVATQKLERIGDLCKNIAEETIYMESGETKIL